MYKSKQVIDIEGQIGVGIAMLNRDRFAPLNIDRRRHRVVDLVSSLMYNLGYEVTPAMVGMIDWIYRDLVHPEMWGSVKSIPYFKRALYEKEVLPGRLLNRAERRAVKDTGLSRVGDFIRLEDYAMSEIDLAARTTKKVVDRPVLLAWAKEKYVVVWLHALAHFYYNLTAPLVRVRT